MQAASSPLGPEQELLNDGQVRLFEEQGYLRVESLTTPEEAREIRQILARLFESKVGEKEGAFADLVAGADQAGKMSSPQILNPVNYVPDLHQTQCFKNALRMARQLLGEETRCFFDHSILKEPRAGAATPWHQDEAFRDPNFCYKELTVWVALQDVEAETGCLQFIPKSHLNRVLEHRSANNDRTSHSLECIDGFEQSTSVACPLKSGDCTIHHHRTLHGSGPNISNTPRFAYIMTFGVTPQPVAERRVFPWLDQEKSIMKERRRRWLLRGGFFIDAWRRLRRGDLVSYRAAEYAIRRSIKLFRGRY